MRGGPGSLIDLRPRGFLRGHQVAAGSNVYAELGTTWRFVMRVSEQAAHALGKLIWYCGPDNVLWGIDSIW